MSPRTFWAIIMLISVIVLAAVALGHQGPPVAPGRKFALVPFKEYGWALRCVTMPCTVRPAALRFLLVNGLGNIVVFMPSGLAAYYALADVLESPVLRIALVSTFGLALSAAFELVQITIPGRIVATDDVLTNGAGALIGALAASAVEHSQRRAASR